MKKMKTELTIEESAHLISLGVDPRLASKKKFIPLHPEVLKGKAEYAKPWGFFPIFDLSGILSILPKEIDDRTLSMEWDNEFEKWGVGYNCLHLEIAPELIDSLYQLLCWCLEQGYVKPKTDNQ